MNKMFLFIGKSASGKTFLVNQLARYSDTYKIIKKKTTRAPRLDESNSKEFEFNCMESEVKQCDVYYEYRSHWYGFDKKEIDYVFAQGKIPITVIRRIETVKVIKSWYPKTVVIYCRSKLSSNELRQFLLNQGHTAVEVNERLRDDYEKSLEIDYSNGEGAWFNYEIFNDYNDTFLTDAVKIIQKETNR